MAVAAEEAVAKFHRVSCNLETLEELKRNRSKSLFVSLNIAAPDDKTLQTLGEADISSLGGIIRSNA